MRGGRGSIARVLLGQRAGRKARGMSDPYSRLSALRGAPAQAHQGSGR
jgi:hypothetical protein